MTNKGSCPKLPKFGFRLVLGWLFWAVRRNSVPQVLHYTLSPLDKYLRTRNAEWVTFQLQSADLSHSAKLWRYMLDVVVWQIEHSQHWQRSKILYWYLRYLVPIGNLQGVKNNSLEFYDPYSIFQLWNFENNDTVVSYQNESFSSKWELPSCSLLPS